MYILSLARGVFRAEPMGFDKPAVRLTEASLPQRGYSIMTSVYKQLIATITIGGVARYMGDMLFSIGAEYQHLSGFGWGW